MSVLSFARLAPLALAPSLAIHLAAGFLLGLLYFRSLWWNTRLFVLGGRAATIIALGLGRFTLLGAVLIFASLEGAVPLLALAAGVLIARPIVMRRVREATA